MNEYLSLYPVHRPTLKPAPAHRGCARRIRADWGVARGEMSELFEHKSTSRRRNAPSPPKTSGRSLWRPARRLGSVGLPLGGLELGGLRLGVLRLVDLLLRPPLQGLHPVPPAPRGELVHALGLRVASLHLAPLDHPLQLEALVDHHVRRTDPRPVLLCLRLCRARGVVPRAPVAHGVVDALDGVEVGVEHAHAKLLLARCEHLRARAHRGRAFF
eukprot:5386976-Prymnesium_polylepis.2